MDLDQREMHTKLVTELSNQGYYFLRDLLISLYLSTSGFGFVSIRLVNLSPLRDRIHY